MKRFIGLVLAVIMMFALVPSVLAEDAAAELASGKYYKITLKNSSAGFCVDMSKENDAPVCVSNYWTGMADEVWLLLSAGDGSYEIINKYSSKNLDVPSGSVDKDRTLIQSAYAETVNQRWIFEEAEDGGYYIKNANSELYLTLQNRLAAQCEKTDDKKARQVFDVKALCDGGAAVPKNYVIKVAGGDKVLTPTGAENAAKLEAQKYDAENALQVWTIRMLDEEAQIYKIRNNATGYSMDVSGNNSNTGSSFLVYTSNTGSNQKFAFEYDEDGETFKIVPQHSLLYCTVKSDDTVCQDELGAEGTQDFVLEAVE